MNNDNRTDELHDMRMHQTGSRSGHDGTVQDGRLPVVSDELLASNRYHYTVEWDTNASEWNESADAE